MRKLVIYNEKDNNLILLFEDDELVEFYEEDKNDISIEGNIYIGKVQNVLPGLQSAFINIGEKKNAFIHVKERTQSIYTYKFSRKICSTYA